MKKSFVHYLVVSNLITTSLFVAPVRAQTVTRETRTASIVGIHKDQQVQIVQDYDQFLQQLGLENFSAKAQHTLETEKVEALEKSVLQENVRQYEIVNTARNLTTFIMSRAIPQMIDQQSEGHYRAEEIQDKLVKLTGQLLDFRRLEGFNEAPAEIETITPKPINGDQKERGEIRANLLNREGNIRAVDNANYSKNQLVTNIIDALYGAKKVEDILYHGSATEKETLRAEISQLESLVKAYIFETYENKSLGTTHWLGRGLTYSLVRFSRLQKEQGAVGSNLEAMLASHLRETYADNLNNYIRSQINTVDSKGNKVKLNIETGSIINESAKNGREDFAKASAVFPKFWQNPGAYLRMMIKGMWVFPPLYFFTSDSEVMKNKFLKGEKITMTDRIRHAFDQTKWVMSGSFSNSAQAIVHEVEVIPGKPESKIEAVMLTEFNQNKGAGGVRWIGLEGFGFMNPAFATFSVTNFDAAKMQEEGKAQLQKDEKPFILWEGENYVWSQEAEKFQKVNDDKTYLELDKDEQREILSMLTQMSATQYKKKYQERLVKTWRDWTYGKNAKAYALNYIDSAKALYAALGVRLAIRTAGFVDPSLKSRFSIFHKMLKYLRYEKVTQLNFNKVFTAPNFAAINTKLIKNASITGEDGQTQFLQPGWDAREFETNLKQSAPKREAFNPRLARNLSSWLKQNFVHGKDSFQNTASYYVETYLYGNVVRDLTVNGIGISMYATDRDQNTLRKSRDNNGSTLLTANDNVNAEGMLQSETAWTKEIREFMFDYGFDDKAQNVRNEMRKHPKAEHDLARTQQLENIKIFEGMNAARELSILFFSRVKGRLSDEKQLNLINDLIARALALQPKNMDRLLTPEELVQVEKLRQLPEDSEEAIKAKNEQLYRKYLPVFQRSIEETTRTLTSEFLSVMYGDNVSYYLNPENDKIDRKDAVRWKVRQQIQNDAKKIFSLASQISERVYMDTQVGTTRWLGRAMLLVLARLGEIAEPNKHYLKTKPLTNLRKHLEYRSIDLEAFIGNKVSQMNAEKKYVKVPVNDMDFAGYFSFNAEAGAIAYGWQPGDTKRAKENGLIGSLFDAAAFIEEEALVKDGYTFFKKLLKASNRGGFGSLFFGKDQKGISHIGYYRLLGPPRIKEEVRRTNSKIQVVYVQDNFPSPVADTVGSMVRPGGARFTGVETFNDTAHDTKVWVAQINQVKMGQQFLEELNKLIAEGKYVKQKGEVVFESHPLILDEKGEPKLPEKKADGSFVDPNDGWRMENDPKEVIAKKEEIESRLKAARSEKEKSEIYTEFAVWLQHRAGLKMTEMIEKGTIFMWITPRGAYYKMATYCSQYYPIAFLIANGFNPELVPDKGPPLTQKMNKFALWAEKNMKKMPRFVQRMLKSYLQMGPVQTAVTLNKLFRVFAPAGLFNQPYVDKSGLHKIPLAFSGLSNILKTTANEFFERTPQVRESLNQLLDPAKYVAAKTLDKYDVIGAGHYEHMRELLNADNGVKNAHHMAEEQEARRSTIKKIKFPDVQPAREQKSCLMVFKTAG